MCVSCVYRVCVVCAQPEVADVWGDQSSGDSAVSGAAATPPAPAAAAEEEEEDVITVDDLYGPGLRYPAPYDAGRPPHDHVHQVVTASEPF